MTLRNALERVIRVVRTYEARSSLQDSYIKAEHPLRPKTSRIRRRPVPKKEYAQIQPHLIDYQKKVFRDFLLPLGIPQLKIYDGSVQKYDVLRAEQNRRLNESPKATDIFMRYLHEKANFEKMVSWLVDLTPLHLKDENTIKNVASLRNVLEHESANFAATRFEKTPRYHFHELPPIPNPLTKENFQEYIYFLTHSKILYRNSLSLMSGIVPDLLLHTHRLDNSEYRGYRSVETYNYLIKYFGHDKFQVPFAKMLLLVMIKDGHIPNVNTINTLIRICKRHSQKRALTLTYSSVLKYLQIAKKFDIAVNLTTWNRVYDCIHNMFLKEMFVNKIATVNLPVSANLAVQILEDYATTTKNTHDLIRFVEQDLCNPHWREDSRICNKILHHQIAHEQSGDLRLIDNIPFKTDVATVKAIVDAVEQNEHLVHKSAAMLALFLRFFNDGVPPETLGKVIATFCKNSSNYDVGSVTKIVRGLIHDACITLQLPEEYLAYEDPDNPNTEESEGPKSYQGKTFPYPIPKFQASELYRILKRLTKSALNELEAQVLHANNMGSAIAMPYEKLTDCEISEWEEFKKQAKLEAFWNDPSLGLKITDPTPTHIIQAYKLFNRKNSARSRTRNLIAKLQDGPAEHLVLEMRQRKLIDDCK